MKSQECEFYRRFYTPDQFRLDLAGGFSSELELVIHAQDASGRWVPSAGGDRLVRRLQEMHPGLFSHFAREFSDLQLEINTSVHWTVRGLIEELLELVHIARTVAWYDFGWKLEAVEWIPYEVQVPDDLNPTSPRYAEFAAAHPDVLSSIRRVASIQYKFGVADLKAALQMYNLFVDALPPMAQDPEWIHPDRLRAFDTVMYPQGWSCPPQYVNGFGLYQHAVQAGFADQPANHWAAIRVHHRQGAVEFRLPGAHLDRRKMGAQLSYLLTVAGLVQQPGRPSVEVLSKKD